MDKKTVLLISFHNPKALGVHYLEKALQSVDCPVVLVYFKGFNSIRPDSATSTELGLLKDLIQKINPGLIGLSVMTSLYLETVYAVNKMLRESFHIPILWGGVYPTLFPEKSLDHADFAIRGEGEEAIIELCDALFSGQSYEYIQNLAYKKDGTVTVNDLRPLSQDLDRYGYPSIGGSNKYYIDHNALSAGDPRLETVSFELTASRGCPFVCSYCCSVNLHRVYKGKGNYVRFRSVSSVIDELKEAKAKMKNLKVIRFWDEIFSDEENWIQEFTIRYKKEIKLPFEIWAHPLKTDKSLIQKLVDAGLYKVVMGIQSGSPRVRKEVFHRTEKQEDILLADKIFHDCKVPQIIYDFMLQHPFETENDIQQTYELCMQFQPPFELQLHGLKFLPGTDIVDMAVKMNILTPEDLEKINYSSIREQYDAYWSYKNTNIMSGFWYALTFMSQFPIARPVTKYFAVHHKFMLQVKFALNLYQLAKPMAKLRYFYKKAQLLLTSMGLVRG